MKTARASNLVRASRQAFTLVELMVALVASIALTGTVFMLLVDTVLEQRNGLADTTVEEKAYTLQANITKCLRCMSANQGMTPDYTSALYDANSNQLGYSSVFVFSPTTNGYITANIRYNSLTGQVTYTPNIAIPSAQTVWMSNSTTAVLPELCFTTSRNLDGSQNSSLVNVVFQMNDNGFSQQSSPNNPTSIYRNFSVQMRNDY